MEKQLNVLIVEDEVLIAKHIEETLISNNFKVIGIAHDSEYALDLIANRSPDFIMLDIHIDGSRDGIDLAEIIKENYDIPFLFLTAFSDFDTLERAKKVNPCAYLVKPFKPRDLISSITIGLYNYDLRKKSSGRTLESINKKTTSPISPKEFEILEDIMQGFTNAQIAKKQFISLSTVKFHTQNIYTKLDVKNRASAIRKMIEL